MHAGKNMGIMTTLEKNLLQKALRRGRVRVGVKAGGVSRPCFPPIPTFPRQGGRGRRPREARGKARTEWPCLGLAKSM